ncbi:MAG: dolichyl-phosphate beta-D-mannosyltransferase [candidate division Zixibacteria bacterium 4484_95]|nr:MAG: dolichyl-phosphate beta-D-mannosyltransferase [candidate division Zixibacteria bacterium 4484_95]
MKNILVCIPTYNEKDNIRQIIEAVLKQGQDIEVLIIDDNSPDGTGDIVKSMEKTDNRIHLLRRTGKLGLGTAYIDGFKYGLTMPQIGYLMEMDADFSHNPDYIKQFREEVKNADMVIGSRYINGISIVNWPISRLLLSYFASKYVRWITGLPVKDPTSGFKCFRREVLQLLNLDKIKSNGYCFQIEMNFYIWRAGFKIKETPIIFIERQMGASKMSKRIVLEAIWGVWHLFFKKILGTDKNIIKRDPR